MNLLFHSPHLEPKTKKPFRLWKGLIDDYDIPVQIPSGKPFHSQHIQQQVTDDGKFTCRNFSVGRWLMEDGNIPGIESFKHTLTLLIISKTISIKLFFK